MQVDGAAVTAPMCIPGGIQPPFTQRPPPMAMKGSGGVQPPETVGGSVGAGASGGRHPPFAQMPPPDRSQQVHQIRSGPDSMRQMESNLACPVIAGSGSARYPRITNVRLSLQSAWMPGMVSHR